MTTTQEVPEITVKIETCGSKGPRIGLRGRPRCGLPRWHACLHLHRGFGESGFERVVWDDPPMRDEGWADSNSIRARWIGVERVSDVVDVIHALLDGLDSHGAVVVYASDTNETYFYSRHPQDSGPGSIQRVKIVVPAR